MSAPNATPLLTDRAWLDRRYSIDGVEVEAIAAEAGCDPANVWRALARHEIPLHGRLDVGIYVDVLTEEYLSDRLAAGWSPVDIAEEVGCSPSAVRTAMARHQLLDIPIDEVRLLRKWYERDGLTIPEVARRLRVHQSTAAKRLRAAGVTLRPPGRRPGA